MQWQLDCMDTQLSQLSFENRVMQNFLREILSKGFPGRELHFDQIMWGQMRPADFDPEKYVMQPRWNFGKPKAGGDLIPVSC